MMRPALTILFSFGMAACGGGGSSPEPEASQEEAETQVNPRQVDIDFINTAGKAVDYFVTDTHSSEALYDETSKVTSCNNTEQARHSISWTTLSPLWLDFGAKDTNTQTQVSEASQMILNDSENVWAIAWMDNSQLIVSTAKHNASNLTDHYRVRVFSHQDTRVQVISSMISTVEVKKGQFSAHMTLENCSGELFFGAEAISLCDLEAGKSYLLITNGEDLLVTAEEK